MVRLRSAEHRRGNAAHNDVVEAHMGIPLEKQWLSQLHLHEDHVDIEPHHQSADSFVVGRATLHLLRYGVRVPEAPFERLVLKNGG